jgi:hypothetical protein
MNNYTQRNTMIVVIVGLLCLSGYIYRERDNAIKNTKQVVHRISTWCKKRITLPPETRKDRYER